MYKKFTGYFDRYGVEINEGDLLYIPNNDFIMNGLHYVYEFDGKYVTSSILFANKKYANKNPIEFTLSLRAVQVGNKFDDPKFINFIKEVKWLRWVIENVHIAKELCQLITIIMNIKNYVNA